MTDPDFIKFEPTLVTVPESTLERALIALEAGWEAASDEHPEAIAQYQERCPLRVKWYAEQVELMLGRIPAGRMGSAAEVASAVCYLASEQAGYITGTTMQVNGGLHMS